MTSVVTVSLSRHGHKTSVLDNFTVTVLLSLSITDLFEIINSISVVSVIHLHQEEIQIIKSTSLKVSIKDHNSGKLYHQYQYAFTLNKCNAIF